MWFCVEWYCMSKHPLYSPYLWSVTVWSAGRHWELRPCPPQVSGRWNSPPSSLSEVCGHSDPEHSGTLRARGHCKIDETHKKKLQALNVNKKLATTKTSQSWLDFCKTNFMFSSLHQIGLTFKTNLALKGWSKPSVLPSSFFCKSPAVGSIIQPGRVWKSPSPHLGHHLILIFFFALHRLSQPRPRTFSKSNILSEALNASLAVSSRSLLSVSVIATLEQDLSGAHMHWNTGLLLVSHCTVSLGEMWSWPCYPLVWQTHTRSQLDRTCENHKWGIIPNEQSHHWCTFMHPCPASTKLNCFTNINTIPHFILTLWRILFSFVSFNLT